MQIKPVKTAVVGCGMISDAYLSTMTEKFNILDVVGCCDLDEAKAKAKGQKYGIQGLTMEEILADPSIELVVNLTTPTSHYPVIKQLLEGGKQVYTEKVLTVELGHAAEVVKIADERNLYLGSAPDTFLGSALQTARYVVDSGMLGEITSCYCAMTRDSNILNRAFPFTAKPGGGIGFDVGIYYITALLSILGPVREVSGVVRTKDSEKQDYALEHFGEPIYVEAENLMVGPNQFGGEVKIILKGNNEPFVMQQSHPFSSEIRGLGVAEMAWSLRMGRKNRANKEMAYHALEVLHGIVKSSETKANQRMQSTFDKPPPIPRGYSGHTYFEFMEEIGLAL
jgi:hypothetical protein